MRAARADPAAALLAALHGPRARAGVAAAGALLIAWGVRGGLALGTGQRLRSTRIRVPREQRAPVTDFLQVPALAPRWVVIDEN